MVTAIQCILCHQPAQMVGLCRVSFGVIARCAECGLVRIWPPRMAEAVAQLHTKPDYFNHPYFAARRNLSREVLVERHRTLLHCLNAGRSTRAVRMLDIGCDTGSLLKVARDEFQMQVTGVDVSPEAARAAREYNAVEVRVGRITTLDLPAESFDLITLIDVIEHLTNPVVVLERVHELLAPGGRVYISTADHDALVNVIGLAVYRVLGKVSWPVLEKLYIPYHEFYFTRSTLARLVAQCGFEVLSHAKREFPLDEFGHGIIFKLGLIPIFAVQKLTGRQTLQELLAVKRQ